MKKIWFPCALCMGLAMFGASANSTMEFLIDTPDVNILTDSVRSLALTQNAYVESGRTLVPLSAVADCLEAETGWNAETGEITVSKNDTLLQLLTDSATALVNGESADLDCPAILSGEEAMVPLRFVAEHLGYDVSYITSLNTVLISNKPHPLTVNGQSVNYDEFSLIYKINSASIPTENVSAEDVTASQEKLKNAIVDMMKQTYVLYASAANSGFTFLSEDPSVKEQVRTQTESMMKEITGTPALGSVLAGAMEKSQVAGNFSSVLQAALKPTDEEVQSLYKEQYISAKHILIPLINLDTQEPLSEADLKAAEKTATEVLDKVKKGGDFDALMKEYSKDTGLTQYPDGYSFTKGEMIEEFENSAFALAENEVSGLVKTSYGYHIIKRVAQLPIDDSTKSRISAGLQQQKFADYMQDLISKSEITTDEEVIKSIN